MVTPADAAQIYSNRRRVDQIRFKDASDEKFFLLTARDFGPSLSVSCVGEKINPN